MNVPGPHTASGKNDAAASLSAHFNTVLHQDPRVNVNCHQTAAIVTSQVLLPQSKSFAKLWQSQHYLHWHLCRPVNIYIMLLTAWYNAADLLRLLP